MATGQEILHHGRKSSKFVMNSMYQHVSYRQVYVKFKDFSRSSKRLSYSTVFKD